MSVFAKRSSRALSCAFAVGLAAVLAAVPGERAAAVDVPSTDAPGSHDSPIVSRFRGSVIVGYQSLDYGRLELPMGKYEHDKVPTEATEGHVTRIAYVAPQGKEALEIYSRGFGSATLRTDVDESFLDPRAIPKPGVNYPDDADPQWRSVEKIAAGNKVRDLLKKSN